jgi:hypothetical protein
LLEWSPYLLFRASWLEHFQEFIHYEFIFSLFDYEIFNPYQKHDEQSEKNKTQNWLDTWLSICSDKCTTMMFKNNWTKIRCFVKIKWQITLHCLGRRNFFRFNFFCCTDLSSTACVQAHTLLVHPHTHTCTFLFWMRECVCVCVCVCLRERERECIQTPMRNMRMIVKPYNRQNINSAGDWSKLSCFTKERCL